MPKIRIIEKDFTNVPNLPSESNVVFIPGKASTAMEEPVLVTKVTKLEELDVDKTTLSYKLAKRLLQLGMQVLYWGLTETTTEGTNVKSVNISWSKLEDRTLYDIRFLTTGEYALPSADMIQCAARRGDCVALLDHPKDTKTVSAIRTYFETFKNTTITKKDREGNDVTIDCGTYASAFTPWFESEIKELGATDNASISIPASFGYLFAYARMIQDTPSWFSAAGAIRGQIPELSDVTVKFTSADVEMLQARSSSAEVELDDLNDNDGIAINPIAIVSPYGYVVWGNRTLKVPVDNELSAQSFLNIRNLVSVLNKALYNASRRFTFELNNVNLWLNFKSAITPVLDRMQSSNGIIGYTIEQVPTEKRARLCARVRIIPIEAVEDFDLEIYLENSIPEVTE